MNADFWHQRWTQNEIGFHEGHVNQQLFRHHQQLGLAQGCWVFVPLCGKTNDIAWLLSQGYQVKGIELHEAAVIELFEQLQISAEVSTQGSLKRYSAQGISIFSGDVFALTQALLGPVDAVYDRAALIALPDEMRQRYAPHLLAITQHAAQLLICYEFDKQQRQGPPFSVELDEIQLLYGQAFAFNRLERQVLPQFLEGVDATAVAWLLSPKPQL
ncbi:thiopurine S-methyltransferase [Atopomonas sediminilitoris]|uniref:thiopurine S-methyltransferase n=1 Tax=Atopomonas sediminilitoris TaxID=2919919 RepID=UPI001F4EB18F|nr:thiopurine S-methyltransferase [Atopomonas sediminilitoris]MCJ8170138.1 thiopurine S-methyltransferase [Atopomonas sediminilitoris]